MAATWQGHGGRGPTRDGDVSGDVVLTQEGGKAVYGFGRTAFPPTGGFGRGGSATVERVTHGGSTTGKSPISQALTIRRSVDGKTRPPLICGAGRSDGWRDGQGSRRLNPGARADIRMLI